MAWYPKAENYKADNGDYLEIEAVMEANRVAKNACNLFEIQNTILGNEEEEE